MHIMTLGYTKTAEVVPPVVVEVSGDAKRQKMDHVVVVEDSVPVPIVVEAAPQVEPTSAPIHNSSYDDILGSCLDSDESDPGSFTDASPDFTSDSYSETVSDTESNFSSEDSSSVSSRTSGTSISDSDIEILSPKRQPPLKTYGTDFIISVRKFITKTTGLVKI